MLCFYFFIGFDTLEVGFDIALLKLSDSAKFIISPGFSINIADSAI